MPMILCPACSHQVSDQATSCPNCGHPLTPYATGSQPSSLSAQNSRTTSAAAIISLVCGLLSWCVLPVIGAVAAVIAGHIARAEIRRAPADSIEGDGMAIAGLILGWAHLILVVLIVAFVILLMFPHNVHF